MPTLHRISSSRILIFVVLSFCGTLLYQRSVAESADSSGQDPLYQYRPMYGKSGIVFPRTITELMRMGQIAEGAGEIEIAREAYQRGLNKAKELSEQFSAAYACTQLARIYSQQGKQGQSVIYHEEAIALYEKLGKRAELAREYLAASGAYFERMRPDLAIQGLSEAVRLAEQMDDRVLAARANLRLGEAYLLQRDSTTAWARFLSAYSLFSPEKEEEYDEWEKVNKDLSSLYLALDSLDRMHDVDKELIETQMLLGKVRLNTGEDSPGTSAKDSTPQSHGTSP